jgi:hypothetical protein
MTPFERLSLTCTMGTIGVRALDSILKRMRAGEKPNKTEVMTFARALHKNKIVDFGDLSEFQPPMTPCAECIPTGRIGEIDLSTGCFTFWEVFRLAAEDIGKTGRGAFVRAQLARGKTARQIIADLYGVLLPDPGISYGHRPESETRTLRRTIQEAEAKFAKGQDL